VGVAEVGSVVDIEGWVVVPRAHKSSEMLRKLNDLHDSILAFTADAR